MDLDKLIRALQWFKDLQRGEMIECRNWTRDYLGFDSISQIELDLITITLNDIAIKIGSNDRFVNAGGEIMPARRSRASRQA
jgi:hypothetical protein